MTVMEAIQKRRSSRSYLPNPVEPEKLQQVLEAGRLAPSANNAQAWKFIAVTDSAQILKLMGACADQPFVGEAPVFLAVCTDQQKDMSCGQPARTIDCSIALSFMILAAAELGLGTCWLGRFNNEAVKELLQIPEDYEVVAVTPLGYPTQMPPPRPRKEMGEVAFHDQWGKSF